MENIQSPEYTTENTEDEYIGIIIRENGEEESSVKVDEITYYDKDNDFQSPPDVANPEYFTHSIQRLDVGSQEEDTPNKKKKQKHELQMIHRALSVARISSNGHSDEDHASSSSSSSSSMKMPNRTDSGKRGTQITRSELCMEFCWCFSCCFASPLCWSWAKTFFANPHSRFKCSNIPMYDWLYALLFSPIYNSNNHELTRIQKLVVFIRLCVELYKTMIGSYLTVFTPQKCDNGICTLTQNLIPRDNMEIVALGMNSIMAFFLLCEYVIELTREQVLRMYFENDPRLPVEKEYFTNLLGIIDTEKATLLSKKTMFIRSIFQLYRRLGIILLSIYIANVFISGMVIYKNYYDKSSLFGFVTNALFIVFKIASILKIAIHSIQIPYSAYIESPVAFNSLKHEYIQSKVKYLLVGNNDLTKQSEHGMYFVENRQYLKFLLENFNVDIEIVPDEEYAKIPPVNEHSGNDVGTATMGNVRVHMTDRRVAKFDKTRINDIRASLCMDTNDIESQNMVSYTRVRHNSIG